MTTGAELPTGLRLAWGESAAPHRAGPRPALTVPQIVQAAMDLADDAGLAECSMPKLAARLGVGTMSLYRYIDNKSDLLDLMLNAATGPVPPDARGGDWAVALEYYAQQRLEQFRRHPWMLDIPLTGFPQLPNPLEWLDFGLRALSAIGLSDQQQLGVMLLLDGHVNATARLARASTPLGATEPPARLMDPARYPRLIELIENGALRDDEFADFGFRFGLHRILDSVRTLRGR